MEYLGQLIAFVAVLIAIKGGTWRSDSRGLRNMTLTGWLTATLAVFGVIASFILVHRGHTEAEQESARLREALENTRLAKESAESLRQQLEAAAAETRQASKKAEHLQIQLATYKAVIDEIRHQSERQPQRVMAEYVQFNGPRTWFAPNTIYGGSLLKLYGFTCHLQLSYGNQEEIIPAGRGDATPVEVAIVGGSGAPMQWSLRSMDEDFCHGKVFLESTPRTRSPDWSWVEERLRKVSQR